MRRLAGGVFLVVTLVSWTPSTTSGQGLVNSETFSGFQFNFNNPGARALGMGGAFVAVADDATAVVANPAGLVILQRPEISAEAKFTRFTNTIHAHRNTFAEGLSNSVRSEDFDDDVVTPSFFSFVYPTERLVLAAFIREQVNYESTFSTRGVFMTDPDGNVSRLFPVRSALQIQTVNFGLGAGVNLEKQHPLLPNIGASLEFSLGRVRARLERFDTQGFFGPPDFSALLRTETVDGTDMGVGFNVGALWRPLKDLAIGIVYRRGPRYDMTFEEVNVLGSAGGLVTKTPFSLKVPDVVAAGVSYRFFERLTIAFEASYIQYSQLVDDFQVIIGNVDRRRYKVDNGVELHVGAEYIFFVKEMPLAARAGFYTNPDHKIRYVGTPLNGDDVAERLLYRKGKDRYHVTGGLGIVPFPGVQLDFAGNYSEEVREFSVSTVFRF